MVITKVRHLAGTAAVCLLMLVGCNNATPTPEPTATPAEIHFSFPVQVPLPEGTELLPDQLIISGGLFISSADSCLHFREDTGEKEYTPVWPVGYLPANDPVTGGIMVINDQGTLAARTGVDFTMSGSEMSAEDYALLFGVPLDTSCAGPYWVIDQVFNTAPQ